MATTTYTTTCTHIELDLSACHLGSNSIADRINDVVPGLKTSTGKLVCLSFRQVSFCIAFSSSLQGSYSPSCTAGLGASVRKRVLHPVANGPDHCLNSSLPSPIARC